MADAVVNSRRRPSWVSRQKPARVEFSCHQARAGPWCGWSPTAKANHTFTSGKERFVIGDRPDPAPGGRDERQCGAFAWMRQLFCDQPLDRTENQLARRAAAALGGF